MFLVHGICLNTHTHFMGGFDSSILCIKMKKNVQSECESKVLGKSRDDIRNMEHRNEFLLAHVRIVRAHLHALPYVYCIEYLIVSTSRWSTYLKSLFVTMRKKNGQSN